MFTRGEAYKLTSNLRFNITDLFKGRGSCTPKLKQDVSDALDGSGLTPLARFSSLEECADSLAQATADIAWMREHHWLGRESPSRWRDRSGDPLTKQERKTLQRFAETLRELGELISEEGYGGTNAGARLIAGLYATHAKTTSEDLKQIARDIPEAVDAALDTKQLLDLRAQSIWTLALQHKKGYVPLLAERAEEELSLVLKMEPRIRAQLFLGLAIRAHVEEGLIGKWSDDENQAPPTVKLGVQLGQAIEVWIQSPESLRKVWQRHLSKLQDVH